MAQESRAHLGPFCHHVVTMAMACGWKTWTARHSASLSRLGQFKTPVQSRTEVCRSISEKVVLHIGAFLAVTSQESRECGLTDQSDFLQISHIRELSNQSLELEMGSQAFNPILVCMTEAVWIRNRHHESWLEDRSGQPGPMASTHSLGSYQRWTLINVAVNTFKIVSHRGVALNSQLGWENKDSSSNAVRWVINRPNPAIGYDLELVTIRNADSKKYLSQSSGDLLLSSSTSFASQWRIWEGTGSSSNVAAIDRPGCLPKTVFITQDGWDGGTKRWQSRQLQDNGGSIRYHCNFGSWESGAELLCATLLRPSAAATAKEF